MGMLREIFTFNGRQQVEYPAQHESDTPDQYKKTGERNPLPTKIKSSKLQEQKTEADASGGVITFSHNVWELEIFNRDTSDGVFTVNGIEITVPADTVFQSQIAGTPSKTVSVSGTNAYILGRYA